MWPTSQLMARRRSRRRREEGRVAAAKWEKGVQLLHSHACQPSNPDRPFRSEISTLKTFRFPRTDSTLLQATGAAKIGRLTLGFWAGRPRSACRAVLSVACCVLRAACCHLLGYSTVSSFPSPSSFLGGWSFSRFVSRRYDGGEATREASDCIRQAAYHMSWRNKSRSSDIGRSLWCCVMQVCNLLSKRHSRRSLLRTVRLSRRKISPQCLAGRAPKG